MAQGKTILSRHGVPGSARRAARLLLDRGDYETGCNEDESLDASGGRRWLETMSTWLELLLERGYSPDLVPRPEVGHTHRMGLHSRLRAFSDEGVEAARLLLERGSDIAARPRRATPLINALLRDASRLRCDCSCHAAPIGTTRS